MTIHHVPCAFLTLLCIILPFIWGFVHPFRVVSTRRNCATRSSCPQDSSLELPQVLLSKKNSQRIKGLLFLNNDHHLTEDSTSSYCTSRRAFSSDLVNTALITCLSAGFVETSWIQPSAAQGTTSDRAKASTGPVIKVLVLGGTGFVGSQVVKKLRERGIEVEVTSRDGRDGTIALDVTKEPDVRMRISNLAKGCTVVISCIGAIGTSNDLDINAATGLASDGAKSAGVSRFVYITVAPEVKDFASNIDFLQAYMDGKAKSRLAVLANFGSDAVLIEPTFIYGGASFELNPPRVPSLYGTFVEGILSSLPLRAIEGVMPPGFLKIALEPPVPVEDVAAAAVGGALGISPNPILDSYDKIKQAAAALS